MEKLSHSAQLEMFQTMFDNDIDEYFVISNNLLIFRYDERYFDKRINRVFSRVYYRLVHKEGSNFKIGKTKFAKIYHKNGNLVCKRKVFGLIKKTVVNKNGKKVKMTKNEG